MLPPTTASGTLVWDHEQPVACPRSGAWLLSRDCGSLEPSGICAGLFLSPGRCTGRIGRVLVGDPAAHQ